MWGKITGILAVLGTGLLLACMIWTVREAIPVETEVTCAKNFDGALKEQPTPDDNAGKLRIVGVFPAKVSLGGQLCVVVAGVAKPADEKAAPPAPDAKAAPSCPDTKAAPSCPDARAAPPAPVPVTLYLNGERTMISDMAAAKPGPQLLRYPFGEHIDARTDASKFWRNLLAGKTRDGTMTLSVGVSTAQTSQPSTPPDPRQSVDFIVYKPNILYLGIAAMLVLSLAFVIFARNSTVLKDTNGITYSLGRSQMALWLGLTVAGFIFLWLTLGFYLHVITNAILVLLGINSVTGLASVVIDNQPAQQQANQANPANPAPAPVSRGFWMDLICDNNARPQLHRIQMIAWTFILAIIFTWNVFANFVFVEFDTNLLLLMGIASGTYMGFKTQEK